MAPLWQEAGMHDIHFPGETPPYRAARNELLEAERDLRRQVERVAALRRRLTIGPAVVEDYAFDEIEAGASRKVRLSELFAKGKDTLVVYNYMFSSEMEAPCPMCTCFLDGLDGNAAHLEQRVNLAVVAKSPIARIQELARSRGWRHLRLLSSAGNTFNRDFHGEDKGGSQNTIIHVFVLRPDGVHHFYSSELELIPADEGQNQRHIDMMWPIWNVLDLTPEGRGTDWFPRLSYG
jgi:predicted dithiol-disulfide oxidoreductase (DUF899 family)